jgi:hypothetical protein
MAGPARLRAGELRLSEPVMAVSEMGPPSVLGEVADAIAVGGSVAKST